MDFDAAVHAEHELVMAAGVPGGGARGPDGFDHVLEVLSDGDALVRFRLGGDLEDVGEDVVLRVVIDDVDPALPIVVERAEHGGVVSHGLSSPSAPRRRCPVPSLMLTVDVSRSLA